MEALQEPGERLPGSLRLARPIPDWECATRAKSWADAINTFGAREPCVWIRFKTQRNSDAVRGTGTTRLIACKDVIDQPAAEAVCIGPLAELHTLRHETRFDGSKGRRRKMLPAPATRDCGSWSLSHVVRCHVDGM